MKDSKSHRQKVTSEILAITAELTGSAIDLAVLAAALGGGFFIAGPRGKDLYAHRKTQNALKIADWIYGKYKKSHFREALNRAAEKGYLIRAASDIFSLTDEGRKRLFKVIPDYKKSFKWDGQLWLVTYDVSENLRHIRNVLRNHLEEIGCGLIQKSVWLSVRDPRQWLSEFVESHELKEQVIVSHLGSGGAIGEEDVKSLISRVYKTPDLARRYKIWIKDFQENKHRHFGKLALKYLAILRNDPVLPKELLPAFWIGNKAKHIFEAQIIPHSPDLAL